MRKPDPLAVNLGRIAGVFGLRGELKLEPTRAGNDTLRAGLAVSVETGEAPIEAVLRSVREHGQRALITFAGIDTPEAAQRYVGGTLYAHRSAVPLAQDEYLDADLTGCTLIGPDGTPLGKVAGVAHYPAQDMLIVGAQRAMVPLVKAFVRHVDIGAKRITVELPPGLLDPDEAESA